MASFYFKPNTYDGPSRMAGPERDHPSQGSDMWRYFRQLPIGYHVLIAGSVVSASPGLTSVTTEDLNNADSGSGEGGKAWFRGGLTYTVTQAEADIITVDEGYSTGTLAGGDELEQI